MIWKVSKKRISSTKCTSLANLNEDVLRLILEQVRCIGKKASLLNVCLVSRQFYSLAVSQLYGMLELDFSRMSHRRLLQRLINPNTHLARMIRRLSLNDVRPTHHLQLLEVYVLLTKPTNLAHLVWSANFEIPRLFLERLSDRFPRALLTVRIRQTDLIGMPHIPPPLRTIASLPVVSHLTSFQLFLSGDSELPTGFKEDLVVMLTRNRVLRRLYIHAELKTIPPYAEMVASFDGKDLPRLQAFWVYINHAELFTRRELRVWGDQGGWKELTHLYTYHVPHLLTFVGKVPKLKTLYLSPRRQHNINELEEFLHETEMDSPLGDIESLSFKGQPVTNAQARSHTIPWCLIERLPRLTKLDVHRVNFMPNHPGATLDTPTAKDVRDMLRFCPDIATLSMDLSLRNRSADWPGDILIEVARFKKLENVVFYLHIKDSMIARASVNLFTCFNAFNKIHRERRRMEFLPRQLLIVGFKVVAPWRRMASNWNVPDFRFTSQWKGDVEWISVDGWEYRGKSSVCLDTLSTEELMDKRRHQLSRWLGLDRHGYQKEIEKRQRYEELEIQPGINSALHDLLR